MADRRSSPPAAARVHATAGSRVERVLDFLSFVAKPRPLGVLLDEAPRKIAACVAADVASLYLLEGDGCTMVMRGNVGFPESARGTVRLTVGEGITGLAVQSRHPVSAEWAPGHDHYREFPELDEGRFPAFLAAPIIGARDPLGAVVVQRAGAPFSEEDVALVAALTAPISSGLRLPRLVDELRGKPSRRAGRGTQKITLPAIPLVPGRALGAVAALRRPSSSPASSVGSHDAERLRQAIETAKLAVDALAARAGKRGLDADLSGYRLMLEDQRLQRVAFDKLGAGASLHAALAEVAKQANKAAVGLGDAFLVERARDMQELCDALLMIAAPDARASLPQKAVIVADHVSIYDLLVTARAHPVAFVLVERVPDRRARALLELLELPALADVQGAMRWLAPGDLALVDADHGFFIVNPGRSDIAAFRAEKKRAVATPLE